MLFTPDELYDIGNGGGNLMKELARDALENACSLYSQFPSGFGISNPVGDGIQKLNSGVWDSLCGQLPNPTLPPPPNPGIDGGQCCTKEYDLTLQFKAGFYQNGVGCGEVNQGPFELTVRVTGKITAVRTSQDGRIIEYVRTDCQGNQIVSELTQRDNFCRQLQSFSFQIAPGYGADDCGSTESGYPSTPPPPSNPYVFPYVGNDGIQRDIPYEINFSPTINGPTINLPEFPNVCLSFELFGVDIDLCTNKQGGDGDGGISPEDLQRLLDAADKVDNIAETTDDLARKGDNEPQDTGEQEGDVDEDTGPIYGIIVECTVIPSGTGRKFGEPKVFSIGRAAFKRGNVYFSPVPINLTSNFIPAPIDATGYAIAIEPGYKVQVIAIKKSE